MKTKNILYGLLLPVLAVSSAVDAAEFRPGSVRSLGMGGSNVATTNGVDATYWNPAAYGFFGEDNAAAEMKAVDNNDSSDKDFGLDVNAVVGANLFGPMAENLNKLQNIQVPTGYTANTGLNATEILGVANFASDFGALDPALGGLNVTADATVGVRVANYGLGVHQSFDANAGVKFDTQNTGLGGSAAVLNAFTNGTGTLLVGSGAAASPGGYFTPAQQDSMRAQLVANNYTADEAATIVIAYDTALDGNAPASDSAALAEALVTIATAPGDIQNNATSLEIKGVSMREIGVTYGYAVNESLSVGGVLKQMNAEMVVASSLAFGSADTLQTVTDATGTEEVSGMGVDLGVMYRMPDWQFGLTVKNINSPSFEHSSGYIYEMKPQAKAGAAWMPSTEVAIELGLDLTENEGVVATSKSQYWNIGLEWDAWEVLALRAGAFKNIAQNDVGLVGTVGLGLNLWAMRLDVAYAQSNKKVTLEGDEMPVYAMGSVALAVDF